MANIDVQRPPSRLYEVRTVHGAAYWAEGDVIESRDGWFTLWADQFTFALRVPEADIRAVRQIDPAELDAIGDAAQDLTKQLEEPRQWARHGYEIGQKHCGWTDHGVAPNRPPAVSELAEALRLTREYVGEELLPAIEGWSWYDALRRWAPEHLPSKSGLTDAEPEAADADEGRPVPPSDEELNSSLPVLPDPRQAAYDGVYEYIRGLGPYLPRDTAHRNAVIWRAVHTALEATPVGRCVSAHCVEGDHIVALGDGEKP